MKRVSEFAKAKGISRGRAYQLVRSGALHAEVLGDGSLILDDTAMAWRPRKGRPLSEAMAWHLLAALDSAEQEGLRDAERARIRRHLSEIKKAEHPAQELAEKVSARAELREFAAHLDDVVDLRADPRVLVSGVGAAGSGMVAGDIVEGYVAPNVVDSVIRDYILKERRGGNVRLRVGRAPQMGRAAVAADLADWGRVRELREADRIVRELLLEIA
ncbi:hypothetical protein G7067_01660 [Leucobacter insecticola]|uniref:Uncharacterized protein n=1 Tax=Leucobacter insecticola TaxID=2714934 RepID=A0A6G8FG79_9MICO|nr:hypothetical protein [Leucobacter insecticola]QIM15401.1 hypothetical protein G7067_01660 [Leucobacter insecticola]